MGGLQKHTAAGRASRDGGGVCEQRPGVWREAFQGLSLPWVTERSGRRPLRLGDEARKGQAAPVVVDMIQDRGTREGPGFGVLSGRGTGRA